MSKDQENYKDNRFRLIQKLKKHESLTDDFILDVFKFQYDYCTTYQTYCDLVSTTPDLVSTVDQIPHLPISFFKQSAIQTGIWAPEGHFQSSGTTGQIRSKHYYHDLLLYDQYSKFYFEKQFGPLDNQTEIIALLPGYIDNPHSSLLYMVRHLGDFCYDLTFVNEDFGLAIKKIEDAKSAGRQIVLFGVSFALLELAKNQKIDLSEHVVIETGGSKGRGPDLIKSELHSILRDRLQTTIYSEYGMTEMISQAYSDGDLWFSEQETLRVSIGDITDPLTDIPSEKSGILRYMDFLNIDSCCFIETEDLARKSGGRFQILGRKDNSEARGCNLLFG